MKKRNILLGLASAALLFVSCADTAPKDYASISGEITNATIENLGLNSNAGSKDIAVDSQGRFSDTLKVQEGQFFQLNLKTAYAFVYLKNGYDLNLTVDQNDVENTLSFSGEGADTNNYLVEKVKLNEKLLNPEIYFNLPEQDYNSQLADAKKQLEDVVANAGDLDSSLASQERNMHANFFNFVESNYENERDMRIKFAPGKPSPEFVDYENYAGGKTSLADLRGKFVYIDMWATWCGPCKQEIPYLKELEGKYHGKDIHFVSISIDRPNKYEAWKTMVNDKDLSGIQLYAGEDPAFQIAYNINSIPRFILIDPSGNIVNANAPRPSSGAVIEDLFTSLGI
ncbi:TlpA family protein disulfide reductase [Flavobacteriaceae bacterium]|nr:TlpA family protein disulfide reductase [Flavobacteriaceae bacterium]